MIAALARVLMVMSLFMGATAAMPAVTRTSAGDAVESPQIETPPGVAARWGCGPQEPCGPFGPYEPFDPGAHLPPGEDEDGPRPYRAGPYEPHGPNECERGAPCPTCEPTPEPTEEPTPEPTEEPTPEPTEEPTPEPTEEPTPEPTEEPTVPSSASDAAAPGSGHKGPGN